MKMMFRLLGCLVSIIVLFAGCTPSGGGEAAPAAAVPDVKQERTYYYVGINHQHPYFYDIHMGLAYAADQYGCTIVRAGPDNFDHKAQAEALEQVITKKPDGIIIPIYDASVLPGLRKAAEAGIPCIAVEAVLPGAAVLTYVGLDNYQSGRDTARELIERAGKTGNVAIMGNWGASNTDAKLQGVEDYLKENPGWNVVAKLDDKVNTETALEMAKTAFNNYSNLNAIIGLNSSSGAGAGAAMEELGIQPGSITVITHDREDTTLEYIDKGYLTATLVNKTATEVYIAVSLLEALSNHGAVNIPLSADNVTSGVNSLPEVMYNGTMIVTKDNVKNFMHQNMVNYKSDRYK
jgi:ribose transport system substrate-binding protein